MRLIDVLEIERDASSKATFDLFSDDIRKIEERDGKSVTLRDFLIRTKKCKDRAIQEEDYPTISACENTEDWLIEMLLKYEN